MLVWLCLIGFGQNPLQAQARLDRVALVIGNSGYAQLPKLRNAAGDALSVARVLSEKGFTVFLAQDVGSAEFRDTLSFVSKRVTRANSILVYYAGHSEIRDGSAKLLSIDSAGGPNATTSLSLTDLLNYFDVPFAPKAIILDTCLETGMENPNNLYLHEALPLETLLVFATSFGHAAYDGVDAHSVFTGAFLDYITNSQQGLQTTVQSVRRQVIRNSRSNQIPVSISTLTRPFVLNSKAWASQSFAPGNDLLQSYSSSGYADKPLLDTMSIGINPTGLLYQE